MPAIFSENPEKMVKAGLPIQIENGAIQRQTHGPL